MGEGGEWEDVDESREEIEMMLFFGVLEFLLFVWPLPLRT